MHKLKWVHSHIWIDVVGSDQEPRAWLSTNSNPVFVLGQGPRKNGRVLNPKDIDFNYNAGPFQNQLFHNPSLRYFYFLYLLNGKHRQHMQTWLAHLTDERIWG